MANPSNSTVELPMELWILIASYLPPDYVRKLMGLNRAWYELALDARYGQVEFKSMNSWKFVKTVESLHNPDIARRVHSLVIWPEAVSTAIEQSETTTRSVSTTANHTTRPQAPKRKSRLVPTFLHSLVSTRNKNSLCEPDVDITPPPPPPGLSPAQKKSSYFRALEIVSNVTNLEVHWKTDRHGFHSHSAIAEVADMWGILPLSGLRSLTLDIDVIMFSTSFDTFKDLTSLRSLNLQLNFSDISSQNLSMDLLVAPINSTRDSLEQLRFTAWGHHPDLSPVLNGIRLPKLRSLSLRLPFDQGHIKDATCLTTLLSRHQLKHLLFRTILCHDSWHKHPSHVEWLTRAFKPHDGDTGKPTSFSTITSLHIGIKQRQPGYLLANTFLNVEDITFSDVSFQYEDLKATLVHFANREVGDTIRLGHGIKRLLLSVEILNPKLVLLLAEQCPQLQCLVMYADNILGTEVPMSPAEKSAADFISAMNHLRSNDLHGAAMLHQWKLEDLSVINLIHKVGKRYHWECMEAIARCVPAVKSFAGRGHLRVDEDLLPEAILFC